MFWYQSQLVCVKWGKVVSIFFRISNGVRQGGILSPKLFALYMNNLSRLLVMSNVGCYFDGQCMNNLMYADDICILAPTAIIIIRRRRRRRRIFIHTRSIPRKNTTCNSNDNRSIYTYYEA